MGDVKYHRTYHLPWSLCVNKDDAIVDSINILDGQYIVVTEKLYGELLFCIRENIAKKLLNHF